MRTCLSVPRGLSLSLSLFLHIKIYVCKSGGTPQNRPFMMKRDKSRCFLNRRWWCHNLFHYLSIYIHSMHPLNRYLSIYMGACTYLRGQVCSIIILLPIIFGFSFFFLICVLEWLLGVMVFDFFFSFCAHWDAYASAFVLPFYKTNQRRVSRRRATVTHCTAVLRWRVSAGGASAAHQGCTRA